MKKSLSLFFVSFFALGIWISRASAEGSKGGSGGGSDQVIEIIQVVEACFQETDFGVLCVNFEGKTITAKDSLDAPPEQDISMKGTFTLSYMERSDPDCDAANGEQCVYKTDYTFVTEGIGNVTYHLSFEGADAKTLTFSSPQATLEPVVLTQIID